MCLSIQKFSGTNIIENASVDALGVVLIATFGLRGSSTMNM